MVFLSPSSARCTSIYAKHMPTHKSNGLNFINMLKYMEIVLKQLLQEQGAELKNALNVVAINQVGCKYSTNYKFEHCMGSLN